MGRELLASRGAPSRPVHLLMDSAYAGNETRQLALDLGLIPVVRPPKTRVDPWDYDREMYKRRNEVDRLFRRLILLRIQRYRSDPLEPGQCRVLDGSTSMASRSVVMVSSAASRFAKTVLAKQSSRSASQMCSAGFSSGP
jgi:transposase